VKQQTHYPRAADMRPHNTIALRTFGLQEPEVCRSEGRDWERSQVCRDDHCVINALECFSAQESIGYTYQQDYIKINFWLSGRHTTVLDGYGQHDHERPEIFITAGPPDLVKVDLTNRETHATSLAICVLPDFFPALMGLQPDQLPEPLRRLVTSLELPFTFHRMDLTPDLLAAARAVIAAPFAVRRLPMYTRAKAVELMCLLIGQMESIGQKTRGFAGSPHRHAAHLREAWQLITEQYAEPITLESIAREVGLNKRALTRGFRQTFGISVYDRLQKVRMERAYELLQDQTQPLAWIADAVGYRHSCNFSTAFRAYFGCTPKSVRQNNGRNAQLERRTMVQPKGG
jgi:AraC-like DNA-binding protein